MYSPNTKLNVQFGLPNDIVVSAYAEKDGNTMRICRIHKR